MRLLTGVLLTSVIVTPPLAAQWTTSLAVTRYAAHGNARDTDETQLGPHAPKMIALSLGTTRGAWRVQVGGRYLEAGLEVAGTDGALITPDIMSARGGAVEVQRRLAGDGITPTLHAGLGLELMRWSFAGAGDDTRWRAASLVDLDLTIGIAAAWRFVVRGELMAGRSLFTADELPVGYNLRTGIRHGVALGIERRW